MVEPMAERRRTSTDRVVVAMSGGVDSSLAAALLIEVPAARGGAAAQGAGAGLELVFDGEQQGGLARAVGSHDPDALARGQAELQVADEGPAATLEGEPEQKYNEKKSLFPDSTEWAPIRGGDHGQFGDNVGGMFKEFGMFIRGMDEEEWEATQWKASISRDEQQTIIVAAMLDWFSRVLGAESTP